MSNNVSVVLRVTGSVLVVLSYFVILHVSPTLGVIGNLIGDSISLPYFIQNRAWDVVIMIVFLFSISLSKLWT